MLTAPQMATATSASALMTAPGARGIKVESRSAPTSDKTIQADPRDVDPFGNHAAELIRDARRNVAIAAGQAAKFTAFQQSAEDLAKAAADQWLPTGHIVEVLTDIATAHGYFGTTAKEVEAIISQAIKAADAAKIISVPRAETNAARAETVEKPLIQPMADFVRDFVPPDYLLDGILQRRFVYSLTAQTGHGKTAVALLIARLVGGSDTKAALGPHAAEKGKVVYFAGENPDDLRMRVIGDDTLCNDTLCNDDKARISFIPGTFSIEAMRSKIEAEMQRLGGVDLIIVDTSAAYFNGKDELSNTEMGAHARLLRTLTTLPGGPCVLVLCHPVKHVTDPSQLLPRGGGAFLAEVDGNLTLWKHDGTMLDLHHSDKLRGPGFEPIGLRLVTVNTTRLADKKGRLIPTVRAEWISEADTERATELARSDEDVLLQAMLTPGQSIAKLAQACSWMTSKGEPHKSKVDRTMRRLREAKLVKKDRDNWALTEDGKKAAQTAASASACRGREGRRHPT